MLPRVSGLSMSAFRIKAGIKISDLFSAFNALRTKAMVAILQRVLDAVLPLNTGP